MCAGARDFYVTGDFKVEVGSLCTDEDDNDELNEMYWQGWGNDYRGFKKLM